MIATFALSLSTEGIQLLHRVEGGWVFVGDVPLDHPDLKTALADLRARGEAIAGGPYSCKIVLPNDQIRYLSLIEHHVGDERVRNALEGATPYPVEDLSYDWREIAGHTFIAAVARETLDEAEQFARSHGFVPHSFTAIPEAFTFDGEPFFGATKDVPDAARDSDAIHVIGVAEEAAEAEPELEPTLPLDFTEIQRTEEAVETPPVAEDPAPERTLPEPDEADDTAEGDDAALEEASAPAEDILPDPSEALVDQAEGTAVEADAAEPAIAAEGDEDRGDVPDLRTLLVAPDISAFVIPKADAAPPLTDRIFPEAPRPSAAEAAEPKPAPFEGKAKTAKAEQPAASAVAPAVLAASRPVAGSASPSISAPARAPTEPAKQAPAVAATLDPKPLFPEDDTKGTALKRALQIAAALVLAAGAGAAIWMGARERTEPGVGLATADPIAIPVAIPAEAAASSDETVDAQTPASPVLAQAVASAIVELSEPVAPEETTVPETTNLTAPASSQATPSTEPTAISQPEASPAPPMAASDVRRLVLSTPEAERRHAATGVWQKAPRRSPIPASAALGDPGFPGIATPVEPPAARPDLTTAALIAGDLPMPIPVDPPASSESFDLDDRGFVEAAPDGAVTPDGVVVYAGTPPVVPPLRPSLPSRADPGIEPNPLGPVATPGGVSLQGLTPDARPRPRPAALPLPLAEGLSTGPADTPVLRPQARPADFASRRPDTPTPGAVASALETALTTPADPAVVGTAQAVTRSLRPSNRPANLAARRTAAATAAPAPAPAPAPAVPTPQVAQPSGPTSTTVARGATIDNAINLRRVNLIGVYGRPNARSALVRLPNGRFMKVQPGDRLDGGRVAAIGESQLSYVKRGRTIVLDVPSG